MSKSKIETIFDNEYIKLYEKVYELNTPADYIIFEISEDEEELYYTVKEAIIDNSDQSIFDLFEKYNNDKISFKDFICAYFYYILEEEPDEIRNEKSSYLYEQINYNIETYNQFRKEESGRVSSNYLKYESLDELLNEVNNWTKTYNKLLEQDLKEREKLINIKKELNNTEKVEILIDGFEKMTYEFIPNISFEQTNKVIQIRKESLDRKIGILLFNEMECSIQVPYIQLNSYDGNKYYKIFDSPDIKDLSKIVDQDIYSNDEKNIFFFKVLLPEDEKYLLAENKEGIKKSSFITAKYRLEENKLEFISDEDTYKNIVSKLNKCYKLFNIREPRRKYNINANLSAYNFKLDPAVIHFLIFNEIESEIGLYGLINTYFFINENDKTLADKNFIEIKFKSLSNNSEDELTTAILPSSLTAKITQEGENLIIRVIRAMNMKVIKQFIEIFGRFLTKYQEYESDIKELYDTIVVKRIAKSVEKSKKDKTEKKVKQLRETFLSITNNEEERDTLFNPGTTGYTRTCECKKQPIILTTKEDIEDWQERTFEYKDKKMKRQVGAFPPDKPKFSFICPEDDYPFPSVAKNNDPVNSKIYPFVPCCAKTDEINNPKSNYNNYKTTKVEKENPNKNYKLNTIKILEYGRSGEIPKQIQNLLDSNEVEDKKFKFQRYGFYVNNFNNSFIHCVLMATNNKDYISLVDFKDREKFCITLRKNIPTLLPNFYEIVKQENYNQSKNYVKSRIINDKIHFNSALYYRILEELFNVNIFVILHKENMISKEIKSEDPAIEIPNHMLVHIRPLRLDRQTIVIIKHMGGEMENITKPQYDLIFNSGILIQNEDKGLAIKSRDFIFGDDMTQLMYNAIQFYNRNIIFNINDKINSIEGREFPYSRIFWEDIFRDFELESQNIDANGKTRSLNLIVKNSDIKLTVYILPSQPLNLPESNIVYSTTYDIATTIFGKPSKEIDTGLWYKVLDYEHGIFIPCLTNSIDKCPESPLNNKIDINDNSIINFRNVKKYSKLLIDCIIWGLRSNGILNLQDYVDNYEKYIIINEDVRPNILPIKDRSYITDKGNFSYLNTIWPEYFYKNNTVQLYPELYDKIIRYLGIYYKNTDGKSYPPNPFLTDVFKYEWDFKHIDQNRVLVGEDSLTQWFKLKENTFNGELQIFKEICIDKITSDSEIPFIYDFEGRLYLIQSVRDGNFNRALNCGNIWNENKINKGYETNSIKPSKFIPHVIYNISSSLQLFLSNPEDDKTNGESIFVSLLLVSGKYLAMLPLI